MTIKHTIKCWYYNKDAPAWAACSHDGGNAEPIRQIDGDIIYVCPRHYHLLMVELADLELTAT
jgi:hypothetical protein